MVFMLVGSMCFNTHATNISDLEDERDEYEDKKEEVQGIVDQLASQQDNILAAIAELDAIAMEYNNQILELEQEKANLEADILVTQEELEVAKAEEDEQYEAMKLRIQYSYENSDDQYIETIFSNANVVDIVNEAEYAEQIYNYDAKMLEDLIDIRTNVANKETELQADLEAVKVIEKDVTEKKEAVEIVIAGKEAQVESYAAAIDEYEEVMAEYQAAINNLDAEIAAAEAAANAAANAGNGSNGNYYTGSGDWGWPVLGNYYYISSHFGPRDLAGTSYHHGMDIPCPTGTPIVACENGVVILSTYNSSLGYYVTIDHGGGITTTYGHNSVLAVSKGQYVNRGDVIAYAGDTGFSFGAHCHIAFRVNGQYVDPYPYLN